MSKSRDLSYDKEEDGRFYKEIGREVPSGWNSCNCSREKVPVYREVSLLWSEPNKPLTRDLSKLSDMLEEDLQVHPATTHNIILSYLKYVHSIGGWEGPFGDKKED